MAVPLRQRAFLLGTLIIGVVTWNQYLVSDREDSIIIPDSHTLRRSDDDSMSAAILEDSARSSTGSRGSSGADTADFKAATVQTTIMHEIEAQLAAFDADDARTEQTNGNAEGHDQTNADAAETDAENEGDAPPAGELVAHADGKYVKEENDVAVVDFGAPPAAAHAQPPVATRRARPARTRQANPAGALVARDAARVAAARARVTAASARADMSAQMAEMATNAIAHRHAVSARRARAGGLAPSSTAVATGTSQSALKDDAAHVESGTTCSVLYQHGASRTCSSHVNRAIAHMMPHFRSAYDGRSISLTQLSVRTGGANGQPAQQLYTSLPPKVHRQIPLGPVSSRLMAALPRDDPAFPPEHVFESCAIVGSSGILLKFNLGEDIDKHELVMRFNSAPTRRFEKHVGRKTTHRLTNTRNFAYREYPEENVLVHLRNRGSLDTLVNRRLRRAGQGGERLYGLNPNWHMYMDQTFRFLSTSGFNGIMLGLHVCQSVTLYGFHVHPRHGALYHYYNPKDVAANEARDGDEWFIVKAMTDSGAVRFAEPCIVECHNGDQACRACLKEAGASM
ncbi:beta-galactoside alpha-2,6-sialyltransferase 2 [Pycnococcus provasolii]|uniref:beta-galactoside alpha-(2,6)-sialyltransferase n=1 Tax=Pycnococcus provasolii TaxID=41880 RepID=A0A830HC48_9CHLO|nr:beta-galactoside alpha-2,6-sialyltransferase 2 [Pycnococcus provasolii]